MNDLSVILRDITITRDARWLYAYLYSLTNLPYEDYPSRDMILKEGKMSKNKYYQCLKELKERQLITIEVEKHNGRFSKNIYKMTKNPTR